MLGGIGPDKPFPGRHQLGDEVQVITQDVSASTLWGIITLTSQVDIHKRQQS